MSTAPRWFDEDYYINQKAQDLVNKGKAETISEAQELFLNAIAQIGMSAYDHYVKYGDSEGLSPNPLFNREYYINQKAQDLVDKGKATSVDEAKELFLNALKELGMTVYEHFHRYGWKEGLNPSETFDISNYFEAKLSQLKQKDPEKYADWTVDDVKEAFENAGLDPVEHAILYGKDEGIVTGEALEAIQKAENPGQTFTLTTEDDVITGTSGSDTITGVISALSRERTLDPADQIDGGDGLDTIELTVKGSFSGFSGDGKLENVEIVKLTNPGDITRTFTAQGVSGVEKYIIESENSTVNLSSLAEIPDEVDLSVAKDTTIGFASNVTSGSSDSMTLKVEDMGSSSSKITVTVNGIENLTVNSDGTANYITISDNALKNLTIEGDASLTIDGIGTTIETVDASNAEGAIDIDLTGAGTSLSTVKTGSGDDTLKINIGSIRANAEIDGGEGSDVAVFGGAGTVQFTMGNVETLKFDNLTGSVTFSAKNTSGVQNIVATKNLAQNVTVANLGSIDLTVELQGANPNSGKTISLDHSGSTTVKIDSPSSSATTSNPDENQLDITLTNSTSLDLQVAEKMAYSGDIIASNAESITISVAGQLSKGANIATITAGNAQSATISSVAYDSSLELKTSSLVELDITASADLDLNPTGTTPDLSSLQDLTVSVSGDGNTVTLPNLPKIHSIELSGTGSVELGSLGSATLSDYGITITAQELAGNGTTNNASLEVGTINTKGTDVEIDASGVTGNVILGEINAANGATTPGDVTLNLDGVGGNITLNANPTTNYSITGYDVTIDAEGALGTITYGGDINVGHSLELTGVELQSNTIDGTGGSGTINPTGSSFTASITGGIKQDSFKIVTADANDTTEITVTGDLDIQPSGAQDKLEVDASAETDKAVTIDISGLSNVEATTIKGGAQGDTIKGGAGNDTITGGAGADTITTGDGNDTVILDYFATADNITDFTSESDIIAIDVATKNAGTNANKLASAVYTAKATKIRILKENGGVITGIANISVNAAIPGVSLTDNEIYTYNGKISAFVGNIGNIINDNPTNLIGGKGVLVVYTTQSNKLCLVGVSDPAGDNSLKAITVFGTQKYVTLATLSADPAAADIHIF